MGQAVIDRNSLDAHVRSGQQERDGHQVVMAHVGIDDDGR